MSKPDTQATLTEHQLTDLAVEAGLDAASDAVSAMPKGQQRWSEKEYEIAVIAAKATVAAYKDSHAMVTTDKLYPAPSLRTVIQRLCDSRVDTVGDDVKPRSLVETFWLNELENKLNGTPASEEPQATPGYRARQAIAEILLETRDFVRARDITETIISKLLPAIAEMEERCPIEP